MNMSILHEHFHISCKCPRCISCQCCVSLVHAACHPPCCMPLSMLHVPVYAAFPWPFRCPYNNVHAACPGSMLQVQVHAACPCPCCKSISTPMLHVSTPTLNVHAHMHAPCLCPCCISLSMHFHVHAACPCPCCMSMSMMSMLRVHVACPCYRC